MSEETSVKQAALHPYDGRPPEPSGGTADSTGTAIQVPGEEKAPKQGKKHRRKSTGQLLAGLLIKLALIAAAIWCLLSFVLGLTIHYGNNMYPAIRDGDLIVAYRLKRPFLSAAVLYRHEGKLCMGRVAGMPGNEIFISEDGAVTVNGTAPAEEIFYPTHPARSGTVTYPYTVGADQVFILNDFRSDTDDSRSFGAVDMDDVIGPVLLTMRRRGF